MRKNPIICALDTKDLSRATALAQQIHSSVGALKLGLEFFIAHGAEGVKTLQAQGLPIFLDLKLHDIPNTVAEAARAATALGVWMLTLHAGGGYAMLKAARDAVHETSLALNITPPLLMGVTVLTSMDQADLAELGLTATPHDHALRLAAIAQRAGLDGVICSAHEIESIKAHCGKHFKTIVPGIRLQAENTQDQKRVLTPTKALQNGADFLVIGRPITAATDPAKAASDLWHSIQTL